MFLWVSLPYEKTLNGNNKCRMQLAMTVRSDKHEMVPRIFQFQLAFGKSAFSCSTPIASRVCYLNSDYLNSKLDCTKEKKMPEEIISKITLHSLTCTLILAITFPVRIIWQANLVFFAASISKFGIILQPYGSSFNKSQ